MSEPNIDPIASGAVEGKPLPKGHRAKVFAAGLPDAHPVKRLLTGEAQWLGDDARVYCFLRLLCEVYGDLLRSADDNGILRSMAPLDQAAITIEEDAFARLFPDDVLYQGRRYRLSSLLNKARAAVLDITGEPSSLRSSGLTAFDRTFAQLVRAIRLS